jgi:hypothetical protein
MIHVTAPLWLWTGESASWYFITVPEELSDEIRAHSLDHRGGFGSVSWRTSVFPQKSGGYLLPVKADVRRRADIAAGDEVSLTLELL